MLKSYLHYINTGKRRNNVEILSTLQLYWEKGEIMLKSYLHYSNTGKRRNNVEVLSTLQ